MGRAVLKAFRNPLAGTMAALPYEFAPETILMSSSWSLLPVSAIIALTLVASAPAPAGEPPDHPMRFEYVGNGGNCAGCEWVSAMGVITSDTPETVERFLARHGRFVPAVTFHSGGGDVRAALTLGMMIRERGIDAAVGERGS